MHWLETKEEPKEKIIKFVSSVHFFPTVLLELEKENNKVALMTLQTSNLYRTNIFKILVFMTSFENQTM